jgi:hypothetical protein
MMRKVNAVEKYWVPDYIQYNPVSSVIEKAKTLSHQILDSDIQRLKEKAYFRKHTSAD